MHNTELQALSEKAEAADKEARKELRRLVRDSSPEVIGRLADIGRRAERICWPGMRPVLSFVTMITITASANMFGQSYLMTRGAPGTETRTAIYTITETGLRNFQMGDAAAMSYVLTLFLMLLSVVVFWLFRERRA